jgi:threonine/homoserine/homoserine lactone efflux protein
MPELPPILVAALTGFLSGLLLCIPVGPINLTIINEGARRGFRWAALIGLGASAMEVIYCALAFTSFSTFFTEKTFVKAALEVFSFAFMLFLGIKFLMAKTVTAPIHISRAADKLEDRIEEKLNPHSAFFTGFVRVMANPGVLLFWIFLAVYFMARDWVQPTLESKLACIGGVAVSTTLWFVGLSWAMSLGHGKFSEKTLLRMEHYSGAGLLVLGLIHGVNLAWQLAKQKM